eukprot:m.540245 g.540245  ORF g.540245 m.540245 type:complete len:222 (+) comp22096_c0_seq3:218-883(+)
MPGWGETLFGATKKPDPKEQVREWKTAIRGEIRQLDRQIRKIEREEDSVKASLKKEAKNNNMASAKVLARSLANSKKAKLRIHTSKAQMNSVSLEIQNQARMLRISNTLEKSTSLMSAMNQLVSTSAVSETMRALTMEMTKAGVIEETINEAMDASLGDSEEIEEAADEEVNSVLWEITNGMMGEMPVAGKDKVDAAADKEDGMADVDAFISGIAANAVSS